MVPATEARDRRHRGDNQERGDQQPKQRGDDPEVGRHPFIFAGVERSSLASTESPKVVPRRAVVGVGRRPGAARMRRQ